MQVLRAATKLLKYTLTLLSVCGQGLLDRDVSRRLTAVQTLEHPWVRPGGCAPDRPLEGTVVRARTATTGWSCRADTASNPYM